MFSTSAITGEAEAAGDWVHVHFDNANHAGLHDDLSVLEGLLACALCGMLHLYSQGQVLLKVRVHVHLGNNNYIRLHDDLAVLKGQLTCALRGMLHLYSQGQALSGSLRTCLLLSHGRRPTAFCSAAAAAALALASALALAVLMVP